MTKNINKAPASNRSESLEKKPTKNAKRAKTIGKFALAGLVYVGGFTVPARVHSQELGRADEVTFQEEFLQTAEDTFPVDIAKGIYSIIDSPDNMGEACENEAFDLQAVESYSDQKEYASELIGRIENAENPDQIIQVMEEFYDKSDVKFIYHNQENPIDLNPVEEFQLGEVWFNQMTPYNDTEPEGFENLRIYAGAHIKGMSDFTPQTIGQATSHVVFTGEAYESITAYAMDGFRDSGMLVFELDKDNHNQDTVMIAKTAVHELAHGLHYNFSHENNQYFRKNKGGNLDIGTRDPNGFSFNPLRSHSDEEMTDIKTNHPEWFVDGPERVFARDYGAKSRFEDFAVVADTIYLHGLTGRNSPNWGSLLHLKQLDYLKCREIIAPGYVTHAIAESIQKSDLSTEEDMQNLADYTRPLDDLMHEVQDLYNARHNIQD